MSIVRVLSLVIIAFQATDGFFHPYDRCEKIYIPLCVRVLPYNLTRFPNLLGDRSQVFVNRSMLHYGSLVEHANCSKNAVFLFCSFFLPMCMPGIDDHDDSEENRIIKPCRSLCEQVRADCRNTIGADQWPPWAKCEELPQYSENVCISPESFVPASNSSSKLKGVSLIWLVSIEKYTTLTTFHFKRLFERKENYIDNVLSCTAHSHTLTRDKKHFLAN